MLNPTAGAVGNNGGCPLSYTFTATEAGYAGLLTETAPNFSPQQTQFTVSPASVASGGTFTVTDANPGAAVGTWNITISDTKGNMAIEMVTSVTCLP